MYEDFKSELFETALFKKYKEQHSVENELLIYNNTHTDKMYRALPCTLKQRKIQDNPIVMVQMLSKIKVKESQLRSIDFQPKFYNETPKFPRFQTPTKHTSPKNTRSLSNSYRNNQRKIHSMLPIEFETCEKSQCYNNIKKDKKTELLFSSNLRNLLRLSKLRPSIPQYKIE